MKPRHWILIASMLLVTACGDDGTTKTDPSENPDTQDPIPTEVGEPDGTPTAATIGAAGGQVESSDARFSLSIPAGALAADTEIGIQPITNTAWGGRGKGYELTPDGLTFSAPVSLVFELDDELVEGGAAAFADVAVQREDGVWGILKNRTLDTTARTLTCTTTHFSSYSMIEGMVLMPPSASVPVGEHLPLSVRFCTRESYAGDPDLVALVITCDESLVPLADFENWSVNGTVGGSSAAGTVSPTSGADVIYAAPSTAPSPATVAASVRTTFEGRTALLVSNITVTGGHDSWVGHTVVTGVDGTEIRTDVTWVYTETHGSLLSYKPVGVMVYDPPDMIGDCAFVSLTPSTYTLGAVDGFLSIDVSVSPMEYLGDGAAAWPATMCVLCASGQPVDCGDTYVGGLFMAGSGLVSADGRRITGTTTVGGGMSVSYTFTKSP